ncbi:hypothetical protein [Hymenobacter glaciei]|uniref:hypothetical protein n=1 Tax=Hymenobacter glaciei TaxID=877209 RepID=UPI0031EC98E5
MISIPKPCSENWDAMTPTTAGRYCSRCQTEVVDFTRMTDAEVMAFMTARQGQHVCASVLAPPMVPRHPKRISRPWRWVLAVAAFLSGQQHVSALGLPPQLPPVRASLLKQTTPQTIITLRVVVIDDSLNVPVEQGIRVYIDDTKYGATTDEKGEFTLRFASDWEPARDGYLDLIVPAVGFGFKEKKLRINLQDEISVPFLIRLSSTPSRGRIRGLALFDRPAPVSLPKVRKSLR